MCFARSHDDPIRIQAFNRNSRVASDVLCGSPFETERINVVLVL